MNRPQEIVQTLNDMPREELRQLIAHAAGVHAHRDGDGGMLMATALRRIADRLEGVPRRAS